LLAGLVQAPSRLAPTGNLKGARERQKLVVGAMVAAGLLDKDEAAASGPRCSGSARSRKELPNGTYFADWVLPRGARPRWRRRDRADRAHHAGDAACRQAAERAVRGAGLRKAQIALVAMRPDGRVVAMVGGNSYARQPVQPRHPGAAPAGIDLQAVRLSRGAALGHDPRQHRRRFAGDDRRLVPRTATGAMPARSRCARPSPNRATSWRHG
jgi:hypothetical protein